MICSCMGCAAGLLAAAQALGQSAQHCAQVGRDANLADTGRRRLGCRLAGVDAVDIAQLVVRCGVPDMHGCVDRDAAVHISHWVSVP